MTWLYEHEFENIYELYWCAGVIEKGAACDCARKQNTAEMSFYATALIALEQNPHMAQWFAFEASPSSMENRGYVDRLHPLDEKAPGWIRAPLRLL